MRILITESPEETERAGAAFAEEVLAQYRQNGGICIFVELFGELGAGKTAFTRGFASVLSPGSIVRSPTYTIVNEYQKDNPDRIPLFHFDMYRISGEDELYAIGFYDYLDRDGVCIAEWSENIDAYLPSNLLRRKVHIEKISANEANTEQRKLTIE